MTPAVLLHGVGLDRTMWQPFRAELPRPTVAYDLLGLGEAAHVPGPFLLADYVEQFEQKVPDEVIDLVGFSMGALVAQAVALALPNRVRRLVLVSAVHARSAAEQASILDRVAEVRSGGYLATIDPAIDRWFSPAFQAEHGDTVAAVRQRMLTNDVAAYADAYSVFATGDCEVAPLVGGIVAPTLVVTGAEDPRSNPAMASALAGKVRDGRVEVFDGLRHLIPLEAPARLAATVDRFFTDADHAEGQS